MTPSTDTRVSAGFTDLVQAYARARATFDGLAEHRPCDAWMREACFAASFFEDRYGAEIALLRERLSDALAAGGQHRSDCSVYNAPAEEPTACDCGSVPDLVVVLQKAREWIGGYGHERAKKVAVIDAALTKARAAS
jgi:hypothetical protein